MQLNEHLEKHSVNHACPLFVFLVIKWPQEGTLVSTTDGSTRYIEIRPRIPGIGTRAPDKPNHKTCLYMPVNVRLQPGHFILTSKRCLYESLPA